MDPLPWDTWSGLGLLSLSSGLELGRMHRQRSVLVLESRGRQDRQVLVLAMVVGLAAMEVADTGESPTEDEGLPVEAANLVVVGWVSLGAIKVDRVGVGLVEVGVWVGGGLGVEGRYCWLYQNGWPGFRSS